MYSKLEFELEFITPAFIGGAFNEEEVELRPASLIGSLRYWFRNLLGTITDNVDAIYKLEEELFGSQQKAGAVKVKVSAIAFKIKKDFNHLEEKELEALSYIGFGNILKKKGNYIIRPYLDLGSKFQITFLVPKKYEDLFVSFLYLYNFLGSLGGRSRRGWGNFILKPTSGLKEEFKNLDWEVFNKEPLEEIYGRFTDKVKEFLGTLKENKETINFNPLWKFEIVEPKTLKDTNATSLLCTIANKYRKYRIRKKPDYVNFKNFLNYRDEYKHPCIVYNRVWFGLPINVRYKTGEKGFINLFLEGKPTRLASPVIFRLVKGESINCFKPLIIIKKSDDLVIDKAEKCKNNNSQNLTFYGWNVPRGEVQGLTADKNIEKPIVSKYPFEDYIKHFLQQVFQIETPILTLGG